MRDLGGTVRVFLRYLHREGLVRTDLSATIESPQAYRLADVPRSITWDEVRRVLDGVDRRSRQGKRDYAILVLLVTYGLRAREVSALTLDDLDWRQERLRVPERKAGHSTAYPLSTVVGEALLDYLQHGRPTTTDRRVFFWVLADTDANDGQRDREPRDPLSAQGGDRGAARRIAYVTSHVRTAARVGNCRGDPANPPSDVRRVFACSATR